MQSLELALEARAKDLHHFGGVDLSDGADVYQVVSGWQEVLVVLGFDDLVSHVDVTVDSQRRSLAVHVLMKDRLQVLMGWQVEEQVGHQNHKVHVQENGGDTDEISSLAVVEDASELPDGEKDVGAEEHPGVARLEAPVVPADFENGHKEQDQGRSENDDGSSTDGVLVGDGVGAGVPRVGARVVATFGHDKGSPEEDGDEGQDDVGPRDDTHVPGKSGRLSAVEEIHGHGLEEHFCSRRASVHLLEESEQTEDLDGQEDTQLGRILLDAVVGVRRPVRVV